MSNSVPSVTMDALLDTNVDINASEFFGDVEAGVETVKSSNPFYLSDHSDLSSLNLYDLSGRFERVLLLCSIRSDAEFDPIHLADPAVSEEYLSQAFRYLTLVSAPLDVMKVRMHKKHAVVVPKASLEGFNHDHLELDNEELVVMFTTPLKKRVGQQYAMVVRPDVSCETLANMQLLVGDQDSAWLNSVKQYFSAAKYLDPGLEFWKTPMNMTMSKQFVDRRFKYSDHIARRIKKFTASEDALEVDVQTLELLKSLEKMQPSNNYLENLGKQTKYADAASANGSSGKRIYWITTPSIDLTKAQVSELFARTTTDRERYDMFNQFALSKDLCHLVFNNQQVLTMMAPLFKKYAAVYRYILGYPAMAFYMEECIKKARCSPTDRFMFTLDVASKLPWFPHGNDLKQNPWVPLLVSNSLINAGHNLLGLRHLMEHDGYGLVDQAEFDRRFRLFSSGIGKDYLFGGFDFAAAGMAVTGSSITACCIKSHPLMKRTSTTGSADERLSNYWEEFYGDSDIDIASDSRVTPSVFDFLDRVNDLHKAVQGNLTMPVKITCEKTARMKVSREYIEKHMDLNVDHVLRHMDTDEVVGEFYALYVRYKTAQNKEYRKLMKELGRVNPLYKDFFHYEQSENLVIEIMSDQDLRTNVTEVDNEIYLYRSQLVDETDDEGDSGKEKDETEEEEDKLLLRITETPKFKLKSPEMVRDLEVYRVAFGQAASVSNFHLGCVRNFYDGVTTRMMPSAVFANLSGVNIDYKYFAGKRSPLEASFKYAQRAYGFPFNREELTHIVRFSSESPKWKGYFAFDPKNKEQVDRLLQPRKLDDRLFMKRHVELGLPDSIYSDVSDVRYIESEADVAEWYQTNTGYKATESGLDLFKFTTIGADGKLTPLKPWVLDAAWDVLE